MQTSIRFLGVLFLLFLGLMNWGACNSSSDFGSSGAGPVSATGSSSTLTATGSPSPSPSSLTPPPAPSGPYAAATTGRGFVINMFAMTSSSEIPAGTDQRVDVEVTRTGGEDRELRITLEGIDPPDAGIHAITEPVLAGTNAAAFPIVVDRTAVQQAYNLRFSVSSPDLTRTFTLPMRVIAPLTGTGAGPGGAGSTPAPWADCGSSDPGIGTGFGISAVGPIPFFVGPPSPPTKPASARDLVVGVARTGETGPLNIALQAIIPSDSGISVDTLGTDRDGSSVVTIPGGGQILAGQTSTQMQVVVRREVPASSYCLSFEVSSTGPAETLTRRRFGVVLWTNGARPPTP